MMLFFFFFMTCHTNLIWSGLLVYKYTLVITRTYWTHAQGEILGFFSINLNTDKIALDLEERT